MSTLEEAAILYSAFSFSGYDDGYDDGGVSNDSGVQYDVDIELETTGSYEAKDDIGSTERIEETVVSLVGLYRPDIYFFLRTFQTINSYRFTSRFGFCIACIRLFSPHIVA